MLSQYCVCGCVRNNIRPQSRGELKSLGNNEDDTSGVECEGVGSCSGRCDIGAWFHRLTYEIAHNYDKPDMWSVTPSNRWDWNALREMISNNGVRNSLHVAPMPIASTSQILGNNECFEPYTSNIYNRRVLSSEFVVVNKHLLHDLTEMGLWSPTLKN
ncbi:hypothetical protein Fmac_021178 [Flemingia macrophylla]|uniref:Ribonucleotide reductase large subunit domain-containing protein n=1 Tax=Flemingia macrophylla TaxID=520843 RepID=A0ABD1LW74_9FABA